MWGDSQLGRATPSTDKVSRLWPPRRVKLHLVAPAGTLPRDQGSAPCWKAVASEQRCRIPGLTRTLQVMPAFQSQQNLARAGGTDLLCFREVPPALAANVEAVMQALPLQHPSRPTGMKGKRNPPDRLWSTLVDPSTSHFPHCRCSASSMC